MTVIFCLDDNRGMLFNNRRLSRDAMVFEDIKTYLKGALQINEFSEKLVASSGINYELFKNFVTKPDFETIYYIENISVKEADVEIYEQPFGATANLKLQDCTFEQYVKKVFTFMLVKADAISWFTKDNYTLLSLDYYTHELYYKGECKHRITQTT